MYLAPGAGPANRLDLPGPRALPWPDEHVVEPETDQEMIDGQIIQVAPSMSPHADRQVDIAYVIRAHVASGYVASAELLTRVSDDDDFATDACIRRRGRDARGHRYLEEISFEVKHTQSESDLKKRARYLIGRGVRRVFAVYVRVDKAGDDEQVKAGPVKEWWPGETGDQGDWKALDEESYIKDRCLHRPIKVRSLLDAVEADNAVYDALVAKNNPRLREREAEIQARSYGEGKSDGYEAGKSDGYEAGKSNGYEAGKSDGYEQGLRVTVRDLCEAFAIELTPERRSRIDSLGIEDLHALRIALKQHRRWHDD